MHRLVASTFLENQHNYPIINHIDENKLNNNVDNLEWCDYTKNSTHSVGKKVHQIDMESGQILKTFDSMMQAGKSVGGYSSLIISVCKGRRETVYGYKWAYVIEQ